MQGRTSNKIGPISLDIVPIEIEKNLMFNYPNYSSSTLFELPFHRNFSILTKNFTISIFTSIIKEKFKILNINWIELDYCWK